MYPSGSRMTPDPLARCVETRSPVLARSPGRYDVVKISTTEGLTSRAVDSSESLRSATVGTTRCGVWLIAGNAPKIRLTITPNINSLLRLLNMSFTPFDNVVPGIVHLIFRGVLDQDDPECNP